MNTINNHYDPSVLPSQEDDYFELAVTVACNASEKLIDVANYLFTKAKEVTVAKLFPFSNPAGWEEKIQRARDSEMRQKSVKQGIESQIIQAKNDLIAIEMRRMPEHAKAKAMEKATEKLAELQVRYEAINTAITRNQELIEHYEKERAEQIRGRFAGYAGMATDVVAPGAGRVVSLALTGATTFAQVDSAESLSEDNPLAAEERARAHRRVLTTIACTTATLAFSIWGMPYVKAALFGVPKA